MSVIEDVERLHIQARGAQAGEELLRVSDVAAEQALGMPTERREVLGDLVGHLLVGHPLVVLPVEVVDACFQKHLPVGLHHDQIGFA